MLMGINVNVNEITVIVTKVCSGLFLLCQRVKRSFLRLYMPQLRTKNTGKNKLKELFTQCTSLRVKRGAGVCPV